MSLIQLVPSKAPITRVFNSTNVSVPVDSINYTAISFDGTRWDNSGGVMHSNTVNNNRLIAPEAGYYNAWIGLQANYSGVTLIGFRANGSATFGMQALASGSFFSINSGDWFFQKNDYLEIVCRASTTICTLVRTPPHSLEACFRLVGY